MLFHGIGTDIIEVSRVKKIIDRHGIRFLDKIFSKAEQEYCLKHREASRHFAARFAAKEAIAKALGVGISDLLAWLDIEVQHDIYGKPQGVLSLSAQEYFGSIEIHLSISHCHEYATATAVVIKDNEALKKV